MLTEWAKIPKIPNPEIFRASLAAQVVKNPPAVQETWVRSLGQEDPLKKGMVTHSIILAWRIPRTKSRLAGYHPWGHRVGDDESFPFQSSFQEECLKGLTTGVVRDE